MEEKKEFDGQCRATATYNGQRCRQRALKGGEYCSWHAAGRPRRVRAEETAAAAAHSATITETLSEKIADMRNDPALFELGTSVAALKTLLEEHLARLDSIRGAGRKTPGYYNGALKAHGKRIQSIAGELFAAIDKTTKIDERRRHVLTAEEVAKLIAEIRERVIEAAEPPEGGDTPVELAKRLAAAFDSVKLVARDPDK